MVRSLLAFAMLLACNKGNEIKTKARVERDRLCFMLDFMMK